MRKKLLLAFILLTPMSCWSWGSPGVYFGGGIGADTATFKQTGHVKKTGDFNVINKSDLGAQGLLGTVFGGYAWSRDKFYLAGELNGTLSAAKSTGSNKEYIHKVFSQSQTQINRAWGISLLPGILIANTALLYTRFGYVGGHYVLNTTDTSLQNTDKMINGFRFGVGLEKEICKNLGLRAEYSHISYENQSGYTIDPLSSVTKSTIVSPYTNQFEFGLTYRLA